MNRGCIGLVIVVRDFESGLSESFQEWLQKAAGVVPRFDVTTCMVSKLWIDRKQFVHSQFGFRFAAEFSTDRCNDQRWPEEARHIDAFCLFQRFIVFTSTVMIPDQGEMV